MTAFHVDAPIPGAAGKNAKTGALVMVIGYHMLEASLSMRNSTELVVGFVHQTQSLVANPRHQCPVDGYRVPLESFRIVDRRDVRTCERTVRRGISGSQNHDQALRDLTGCPRNHNAPFPRREWSIRNHVRNLRGRRIP